MGLIQVRPGVLGAKAHLTLGTPLVGVHLYAEFRRDRHSRPTDALLPDPRVPAGYLDAIERLVATHPGPVIITEEAWLVAGTAAHVLAFRPDAYFIETRTTRYGVFGDPVAGWDVLLDFIDDFGTRKALAAGGYLEIHRGVKGGKRMCLGSTIVAMEEHGIQVGLVPGAVFYPKSGDQTKSFSSFPASSSHAALPGLR